MAIRIVPQDAPPPDPNASLGPSGLVAQSRVLSDSLVQRRDTRPHPVDTAPEPVHTVRTEPKVRTEPSVRTELTGSRPVTIRVPLDILAALRADEPGYQTRMIEALRKGLA
jgi:uncharacterized protein (DUF4415 family)